MTIDVSQPSQSCPREEIMNILDTVLATYGVINVGLKLPETISNVNQVLKTDELSSQEKVCCVGVNIYHLGYSIANIFNSTVAVEVKIVNVGAELTNRYVQKKGKLDGDDIIEFTPSVLNATAALALMQGNIFASMQLKCGAVVWDYIRDFHFRKKAEEAQEMQRFASWLFQRPEEWKFKYIYSLSEELFHVYKNPYKLPQGHPIFSRLPMNLQDSILAYRIDKARLDCFMQMGISFISIESFQILINDFVPVNKDEKTELQSKIAILSRRFQMNRIERVEDPDFANWLWEGKSESDELRKMQRENYFCPWSGRLMMNPIGDPTKVRIEKESANDFSHIFSLNGIVLEQLRASPFFENRKVILGERGILTESYQDLWEAFINEEPSLSSPTPIKQRRRFLGVPEKYRNPEFWDWLWKYLPEQQTRYFCPISHCLLLHPIKSSQTERRIELFSYQKILAEGWSEAKIVDERNKENWISLVGASIIGTNIHEEQQVLLREYYQHWKEWKKIKNHSTHLTETSKRQDFYFSDAFDSRNQAFVTWLKSSCSKKESERYFCHMTGVLIETPFISRSPNHNRYACWMEVCGHSPSLSLWKTFGSLLINAFFHENKNSKIDPEYLYGYHYDADEARALKQIYQDYWKKFVLSLREINFRKKLSQ